MRAHCEWVLRALDRGEADGPGVTRWLVAQHTQRCRACGAAAENVRQWRDWAPRMSYRAPEGFTARVLAALPSASPAALAGHPVHPLARLLPLVAVGAILLTMLAWPHSGRGLQFASVLPGDPVLLELTSTSANEPLLAAFAPSQGD